MFQTKLTKIQIFSQICLQSRGKPKTCPFSLLLSTDKDWWPLRKRFSWSPQPWSCIWLAPGGILDSKHYRMTNKFYQYISHYLSPSSPSGIYVTWVRWNHRCKVTLSLSNLLTKMIMTSRIFRDERVTRKAHFRRTD